MAKIMSIAISILIAVLNVVLSIIIVKLADFECYSTRTKYNISVATKMAVVIFIFI